MYRVYRHRYAMRFSLRNAAAARVPGRITPMLAIPTPDFAVPYAAPTHENTNADAAPINPKNGATASPESSVDSADARVAREASATAKSIVIEEEIPFFTPMVFCRKEHLFFVVVVVVVVIIANRSTFFPSAFFFFSLDKKGNVFFFFFFFFFFFGKGHREGHKASPMRLL